MGKSRDFVKRLEKKAPKLTLKEKRALKRAKRERSF